MGHNFDDEKVRKTEVENVHKAFTNLKLKMKNLSSGRVRLKLFNERKVNVTTLEHHIMLCTSPTFENIISYTRM